MQTQDPNQNKKASELTEEELKATNGGGLLGGDSMSSISGITQGYLNVSHTDEDGDTNSFNTDFGTGSLLNSKNDD